jgi:hypothetical protein
MLTLRRRGVLRKSDLRESNERLILNIVRKFRNVYRQPPHRGRNDLG